ncbi:MAG: protein translocase subunit SecD [Acidobacteriota bacterium]|jgi:preprotein translocase subunit SecD|nr:protein translocase subunit SecD [Acidobacteriota bacterium]
MQKNLRWKFIGLLVFLAVCAWFFIGPKEKGAGAFSRLNLGLDLKGGIHLVLQVMTDDALNLELNQTADRIGQEFKNRGITFESSKKAQAKGDYSVAVAGVDADKAGDARQYLQSYDQRFTLRSTVTDGKTDFTLTMKDGELRSLRESTVSQALETIRRRVDALGVTEPTLQTHGNSGQDVDDQIIVELPGIDDPDRVTGLLANTAQLELRLVKKEQGGPFSTLESAMSANGGAIPDDYQVLAYREDRGEGSLQYMVVNRVPVITGKELKTARTGTDGNGRPAVNFFLTPDGATVFERATEQHVGENLAIVLDNVVRSAPRINSKIGAEGIIEGSFTDQEASDLALLLRSGALPASLQILGQRNVGASLGNDSIKSGIFASLIGFGLVVVGMLAYYKKSGVNAVLCLAANTLVLMGFMGAVGATLTLPGIAGIILTVGMAVDANILIFERIREELRNGKAVRAAIDSGFSKVFWTIFDSNCTTFIAALFLFQFGTGPVKGFAVTLTVGLVANVFTAVLMSRWIFEWILGGKRVETLSI